MRVSARANQAAFIGMHIIVMPPQHIIIGMPICIIFIMLSQHFVNMSFMAGSIGIISQVMPLAVIVHFIWQGIIMGMPIMAMFIIGIMPPAIEGFIMPPIIIGMGIICIAVFIVILQGQSKKQSFVSPI
ncbi:MULTISPECIES: hypothetical protein [Bradyrhizobium]|uniref:hypothetical protein n=1 Tax=Bradyrhizobium TaxID=374 RepID=UPI001FDAA477|nr:MULTISPECIES: hypothetical protein [Bradyrhizobium]MCS3451236.1 hypothetical protein [Bradyrhizobium elkanii]MCS3566741.1 hypothetical protein [Bradyrhizobium elkanii]MCW2152534.1 hypothetical protein [Bradyrhizobium elkanii]MCW2357588.1 hypothetical protein [Bradyrhizobium elkanii]MCW2376265.1 hypothetical protein [Bradyrhizobium elkanii]